MNANIIKQSTKSISSATTSDSFVEITDEELIVALGGCAACGQPCPNGPPPPYQGGGYPQTPPPMSAF